MRKRRRGYGIMANDGPSTGQGLRGGEEGRRGGGEEGREGGQEG
jgi:hypothetical protein